MRPLLLQITVWKVNGALKGHETGRPCTIRGPRNELEMFVLREIDRTATPKILSVSSLTTKEHPYKVKKNLQGGFYRIK